MILLSLLPLLLTGPINIAVWFSGGIIGFSLNHVMENWLRDTLYAKIVSPPNDRVYACVVNMLFTHGGHDVDNTKTTTTTMITI